MFTANRSAFVVCWIAFASALSAAPAQDIQRDFTITAGNAFNDQTPTLGVLCTFDFGDPKGTYNVLTGFNAAHIYQTPGDYTLKVQPRGLASIIKTIHVLPDSRPVQTVQKGDSMPDLVRGLQNDAVILLPAGSTWDVSRPLALNARNIEFRAAGPGPAPRFRRMGGKAGGYATFAVQGLNITFRGVEFDSDQEMNTVGNAKVAYRGITLEAANVLFVNCTFRNIDDAIFCTQFTRNLLVQSCHFTEEVRGCDLWVDGANLVLLGNKMETSQREHNCRSSNSGFYNFLVYDNDMTATHGKETLTFRNGQDLYAAHNAFRGWVRVGPGPHGDHTKMSAQELRAKFMRHAILEDNTLSNGAWMQINEGSTDVQFRNNRIEVNASQIAIAIQGPSLHDIVLENNTRVLTAGPTQKPFKVMYDAGPEDVVEKGTTTIEAQKH